MHAATLSHLFKSLRNSTPMFGLFLIHIEPLGNHSFLEIDSEAGPVRLSADLPVLTQMHATITQTIGRMTERQQAVKIDRGAASLEDMEHHALRPDMAGSKLAVDRRTLETVVTLQFPDRPALPLRFSWDHARTLIGFQMTEWKRLLH